MREERKERGMKKRIICFLLVVIILCQMGGIQSPLQSKAAADLNLEVTVQSEKSVKLSWKKKKNISVVIYRRTKNSKSKKIATVSSGKNTYVDKKVKAKKDYTYEIYGYQNKKQVYYDYWDVYTGVVKTEWVDCQEVEAESTPQSITLRWDKNIGIKPAGFEIYRSENFDDFKKIKTLNASAYEYIDKTVQAKHTYRYKIRALYKTNAGKKKYGAFSRITKHRAVYNQGKYEMQVIEEQNVSPSAITVSFTSVVYNGDLTLDFYDRWDVTCKDRDKKVRYGCGHISAYSTDGEHWKKSVGEKIRILEGETVYIRFCIVDENDNPLDLTTMRSVEMYNDNDTYYDGFLTIISFDLKKDNFFETRLNGEFYY